MQENALLQYVAARSAGMNASFDSVVIPPGDDMGAVRVGEQTILVTVDQVADGVHVDLATTSLERVGRKCITRNLSDVAAMAARPAGSVVAVSLPKNFGEAKATALFDAMKATAEHNACPLIGGDISLWDGPFIATVTVLGEPAGVKPVLRTGASPGDSIYVTGQLGYSLPTGHHLDFEPRLNVARKLAADPSSRPTAMMDLSDGLAQDLPRMVEHAMIEAALLPIRPCEMNDNRPAWQHAVGDGEDYELLFTAPPSAAIPHEIDGVSITCIGRVAGSGGVQLILPDRDKPADIAGMGWEHHA